MENDNTSPNKAKKKIKVFDRLIGVANESDIVINGNCTTALIDSGSMVTTISEDFYKTMKQQPELHSCEEFGNLFITGAGGDVIPYIGYIEVDVEIPNISKEVYTVPVLVVSTTEYSLNVPVVVGTNIIRYLADIDENRLTPEWRTAIMSVTGIKSFGVVRSTNVRDIELPPFARTTLSGMVRKFTESDSVITEPSTEAPTRIGVCPRIVKIDKPRSTARVPVRIFNMSAKTILIKPKTILCELQEAKVLRSCEPEEKQPETMHDDTDPSETKGSKETFLNNLKVDLGQLPSDQKDKLENLFYKWRDVFSQGPLDLGRTDLVRHEVKLTEEKPFKDPYRRVPPALIDEVREHLHEMLSMGAIRPSRSPFSSNVVIVRKKYGTIRFCIDYRKLNSRTHKDAYAIPKIDDTLHLLSGAKYFRKLDLKTGYWQVEMNENDKDKTAFQVGSLGFFECNRIKTSAKLDACGHRWEAALANYDFTIGYRSGKTNIDADALSRRYTRVEDTEMEHVDEEVVKALLCKQTVHAPFESCSATFDNGTVEAEISDSLLKANALKSEDWTSGQTTDAVISRVRDFVRAGVRPKSKQELDALPTDVKRYLRAWKQFEIIDDVLIHWSTINESRVKQIVIPRIARDTVFKALHNDMGHQGRDRTISLFKERFYWPGMDADIASWIGRCDRCIRRKTSPRFATGLVNIESSAPMELVCIDFLSLEASKGGFENVLAITDHFTRYAQAIPTKNQTARTTARLLFDNYFVHYGFPDKLHSDQGQNFLSRVIQRLCKIAGIKRTMTTPYHPQGNGQTERFNQTLLQMLGTLENDRKNNWKAAVPALVHAYNVTRHESTGYSPYHLMFGRNPKLAIDAFLELVDQTVGGVSHSDYMRQLEDHLNSAYKRANENAFRSGHRAKHYYDRKVRETKLVIGDRVVVRNVGLKGKNKLADVWQENVYEVERQPNADLPVFVVRRIDGEGKPKTLHRNLLLPFMSLPVPPSSLDLCTVPVDDSNTIVFEVSACGSLSTSTYSSDSSETDRGAVYWPPHRRQPGQPGLLPRRQRRQPSWMTGGI